MRPNWGIGVVPPHLMPKPPFVRERRCGTCKWFVPWVEGDGKCERDLRGTPLERYAMDGKGFLVTHPNNECGLGDLWEAKQDG